MKDDTRGALVLEACSGPAFGVLPFTDENLKRKYSFADGIYRVFVKSPHSFKNLLQRQMKVACAVLMRFVQLMAPVPQRCVKRGEKENLNTYVSFSNHFHPSVFSFAFVIDF